MLIFIKNWDTNGQLHVKINNFAQKISFLVKISRFVKAFVKNVIKFVIFHKFSMFLAGNCHFRSKFRTKFGRVSSPPIPMVYVFSDSVGVLDRSRTGWGLPGRQTKPCWSFSEVSDPILDSYGHLRVPTSTSKYLILWFWPFLGSLRGTWHFKFLNGSGVRNTVKNFINCFY